MQSAVDRRCIKAKEKMCQWSDPLLIRSHCSQATMKVFLSPCSSHSSLEVSTKSKLCRGQVGVWSLPAKV